jgi:signal transduction histidine kinase
MTLRVLLVDDSLADQLAATRALERDPDTRWEVEQASTAEEALERVAVCAPDVLLLDFNLPGMDGVALLRQVRERCGAAVPAAVLLTGSGNEAVAVAAMKSGAQDYLRKNDFSPERLRHSLRSAVEAVRRARELEERRVQAERAEKAAREALAVRDELFALATHDLRGPLQTIALTAQLLQAKLPGAVPTPALLGRLELITQAAYRMSGLIDHFLRQAKEREPAVKARRMDLLALVRAKVREQEATATRHTFALRMEGTDFTGSWDPSGLERVLDNLLGNAVKYSPSGGTVTVTLGEEAPGPEGWVRLRVEDEGMGIPAGDLPHVFERFRRGGNVGASIAGTGVGLASALRLVELHGGTLDVESEEGRGSVFTMRLPRAFAAAKATS